MSLGKPPQPAQSASTGRPTAIGMAIHIGMLESLGVNMYTSIAKSLIEFIANAFDADAKEVRIEVPFDSIDTARKAVKAAAKKDHADGKRDGFKTIYETLPDALEITISDNGHGMSVSDLERKYLAVNRNRRHEQGNKSESGLRVVMGRKGLGKLAGFGTAGEVVVTTKRKGETYSTTIVMNYDAIHKAETFGEVKFEPIYKDGLNPDDSGTSIKLRHLRCDSLKSGEDSIEATIARNFFFTGSDFQIYLNGNKVKDPDVEYEFIYPVESARTENGLAPHSVVVDEAFNYPILFAVKFRARGNSEDGKIRGSLPAYLRGARVYCNQRLAAGPTLFQLGTGMHNFHAQDYMECIVHADVLDQKETDLISTNRSALKSDNDVVDAFTRTVTELMKEAIQAHAKFREAIAEKEIQNDPQSQMIMKMVEQLAPKSREPAMKILRTIAAQEGVESEVYREVAPYFVKAVNTSEIFIDLIKSGVDPSSLKSIVSQLDELATVENSDVLKLYKMRRHAIAGLLILEEKSHSGKRDKQYEAELHALLKGNPWLVQPEYRQFLTSDKPMSEVAKKLTEQLEIDDKSGTVDENKDVRPDLVFVAANTPSPSHVTVIELKSPGLFLESKHLEQLQTYMMQIEKIVQADHGFTPKVTGHLIGTMPPLDTKAAGGQLLHKKISEAGPSTMWEVTTVQQLLTRAKQIHLDTIEALEAQEAKDAEGQKEEKTDTAKATPQVAAKVVKAAALPVEKTEGGNDDSGAKPKTAS